MSKTILRKRVQVDCSSPKLTDQSYKKSADINNIMKQYQKTGILPNVQQKVANYIDNTNIPSLEEAHNIIQSAKSLFKELPSNIRKMIDNDPKKLLGYLQDPKNEEFLVKEGVLIQKPKKTETVLDKVEPTQGEK
jgi:phage internal scaffolding protein